MKKSLSFFVVTMISAAAFISSGCDDGRPPEREETVGRLSASLAVPRPAHDITDISVKVVSLEDTCDTGAIVETSEELEAMGLPTWIQMDGGGNAHPFADALFVLTPGKYRVCAIPLNERGTPSIKCRPAEKTAAVIAEETVEVLIVIQCDGDPAGGLDVVAAINDPPQIEDLDIDPSKFITTRPGDEATITATASDPDGDVLTYTWSVVSGREAWTLTAKEHIATFSANMPGQYTIQLVVEDCFGANVSIMFPIHVLEDSDTETDTGVPVLSLWGPGVAQIPAEGQYDFMDVNIQDREDAVFTLENSGTGELVVTDIELVGSEAFHFGIDTTTTKTHLPPGTETTFKVAFHPTLGGTLSAGVVIHSNTVPFQYTVVGNVTEFHGIASLDTAGVVGKYAAIDVEGDLIHVCYMNETDSTLQYMKSVNGGIDWTRREITYEGRRIGTGSAIAADGDNIFISTTLDAISTAGWVALARSRDGGDTFTVSPIETEEISDATANYDDYMTSIALDGSSVYIGFLEAAHLRLGIVKGTYDGDNWIGTLVRGGPSDESGYHSSLEVVNDHLVVSHSGYRYSNVYSSLLPLDLSTSESITIQHMTTSSGGGFTSLAADDEALYVAYYDQDSDARGRDLPRSPMNRDVF